MKRALIALLLLGAAPEPPRDMSGSLISDRSLIDLQACAMRKLAHLGRAMPVPAEGGIDIDLSEPTWIGIANEARYSLHIRDDGSKRTITATYRHPYSDKQARMITRGIAKVCFPEAQSL